MEGNGLGSQTRDLQPIVIRVLTSEVVQDGGCKEGDVRAPTPDARPNLARTVKSIITQPQ